MSEPEGAGRLHLCLAGANSRQLMFDVALRSMGPTLPNDGRAPRLGATASGLENAMAVAGGAALAALAGSFFVPGAGATPLLVIMLLSALGPVAAILVVMDRS